MVDDMFTTVKRKKRMMGLRTVSKDDDGFGGPMSNDEFLTDSRTYSMAYWLCGLMPWALATKKLIYKRFLTFFIATIKN